MWNEQDKEELCYTLLAEFESLSSHKNQHKNEDSQVPEVTTLMVDKEESVTSTTEHQPVQTQDSYPPVLARKADEEKSVNSTADH